MSERTLLFRRLALVGYFGLLFWTALWQLTLSPTGVYQTFTIPIIWIIPLLFPLLGIIRGNPYTHAWANFVVMFYLLHGLTAIYTEQNERIYALIEVLLASTMFIGCSFYARFRGRELGLGLKKEKTEKAKTE